MKKSLPDFKNISPFQQGAFILVLVTILSLGCLLFRQKNMVAWNLVLSPVFLFCFYNPIIGAFQQKLLQYSASSILTFILLNMYIYISGNFVSDFSYRDSDELHFITILVITFYFMFNMLCLLFRGILYMLDEVDN